MLFRSACQIILFEVVCIVISLLECFDVSFPSGSAVKNSSALQETQEMWVQSLAQKDSLEDSMATHSNILTWRIPSTEEPGGLQSIGSQKAGCD